MGTLTNVTEGPPAFANSHRRNGKVFGEVILVFVSAVSGMEQMEAVGRALSFLKAKWYPTFVHSSKLRTKQAAVIIAKHLDPHLTLESTDLIWSCADEVRLHAQLYTRTCISNTDDTIKRIIRLYIYTVC